MKKVKKVLCIATSIAAAVGAVVAALKFFSYLSEKFNNGSLPEDELAEENEPEIVKSENGEEKLEEAE